MSRITKVVPVGDINITVKELLVSEVREWVSGAKIAKDDNGVVDVVGSLLFDDITLPDIKIMSNITDEQMEGMGVSELRLIVEAAKGINPFFFAMRGRLIELGKKVL